MTQPIKVLFIEAHSGDAQLVVDELGALDAKTRIQLEWVDRLEKGLKHLAARRDLQAVLLELFLPDSQGLATLQRVLACAPQVPVIVITSQADDEVELKALQAGAQDFLIKGQVDGRLLARAIQYAIQRKQIELQLADAHEFTERILTSAPIGIFTYRLSGECLSANDAAAQMVGGTIEQLRGQNFHHIESWKRSGLYEMARETITTGISTAGDVHMITSFGKKTWYTAQFVLFRAGCEELLLMMFSDISERKKAELNLRASEEKIQNVIRHSSSVFYTHTPDHILTYVSPQARTVLDCEPEEAMVHWQEFLSDDPMNREGIQSTECAIRTGKRQPPYELELVTQKDRRIWVLVDESPVVENGITLSVVGSLTDITERKLAEKALQEREALLDQTQAISHVGSWELDLLTNHLRWSNEAHRIFGVGAKELEATYEAFLDTVHPEDRAAVINAYSKSLRERRAGVEIEHRIIRQNTGEIRFLYTKCENVKDASGEIVRSVGMVQDVTEREQAEAALAASEKRFRTWIENSSDIITVLDAYGIIQYESPSVKRLLDYEPEELLGKLAFDFIHPEDQDRIVATFVEYIQSPNAGVAVEFRFRHRDGSWRFLEGMGHTYVDEHDEIVALIHSRDITERKQAEKALKEKERLLSEAQRIGHIGSGSYDILHDFMMFSDEMYHLLDVLPADFRHNREDFLALVYPSDRPMVAKWLEDIAESTQSKDLDFRLFHKNGELCYLHCTGVVEFDADAKPSRFIGTVQDVTERRTTEMQINQQIQRLVALSEIDRAIISSFDQRYILNVILSQIISQLHVDAVNVLLLDSENETLQFAAGQGFRTRMRESARLRMGESHAGRAARERRMIRLLDLRETTNDLSFSQMVIAEDFVSYIGVPLIVKGKVKGVLEVFQRSTLQPYQDWLDFFNTLVGQTAIAIENTSLFENLRTTNQELVQAYDATIEGWSRAMDLRDRETEGHTQRVTKLTLELARTLGIAESSLIHIRRGALLHDIGKLGVPDHILFKPGELTVEERQMIEKHVDFAYEMLAPIPYLKPALNIPYFHHEKWDGTGYPLGLKGEQIPIEARIFALVDVWDALLSDRPYRKAWTRERTIDYIRTQSGIHFDPRVVEYFLGLLEKMSGN
jgi:PAS domain S-box-containing protein/putative nucleotidyltransferase with HDIG domain